MGDMKEIGFAIEEGGKVQEMKCKGNRTYRRIKQVGGKIIGGRSQYKYSPNSSDNNGVIVVVIDPG